MFGLLGWVFANGPGNLGSILGRVIPKTLKMVLDTFLLNTQQYKVRIFIILGHSILSILYFPGASYDAVVSKLDEHIITI